MKRDADAVTSRRKKMRCQGVSNLELLNSGISIDDCSKKILVLVIYERE